MKVCGVLQAKARARPPVTRLAAAERKSVEAADKVEKDQGPTGASGEQSEVPTKRRMGRPRKDPAAEAGLAARLAR